jgi:hypothetical protein
VSRFSIEHYTNCEPDYLILDSNKDEGLGICGCATKGDARFVLEALNNYSVALKRIAELEADKAELLSAMGEAFSFKINTELGRMNPTKEALALSNITRLLAHPTH